MRLKTQNILHNEITLLIIEYEFVVDYILLSGHTAIF